MTGNLISLLGQLSEEYQYLDLLKTLTNLESGREDRTGVGTLGNFGNMMRFDLKETFPLLTTKKTFFKGIAEELFWFLQGNTCKTK
jgi:thymidylate synthase